MALALALLWVSVWAEAASAWELGLESLELALGLALGLVEEVSELAEAASVSELGLVEEVSPSVWQWPLRMA